MPWVLVLGLVALLLALIDQFRAKGQSILGWAVICLALIYVVGRL